jgi:hypothetical protein
MFTDESTVAQDTKLGGLRRLKGEFIEEGTYEEEAHPNAEIALHLGRLQSIPGTR